MEHGPTWSTVLMNIGVQALNLLIFFCIFYFGFAKKISDGLQERKDLMAKLQYADDEYKTIVWNAEKAAKEIIWEANLNKRSLLDDAALLAKQKSDSILAEANNKAESVVQTAEVQAKMLESDLRSNYETMIKTTAWSYLKKIFDKEPAMQEAYMEKVVNWAL